MARDAEERERIAQEDSLAAETNGGTDFSKGAGLDRPAVHSLGGDGAPVLPRPREDTEEMRLGSSKLPAGLILLWMCPRRRIGDDPAMADGSVAAARASKAARVLGIGSGVVAAA
jgi:hypothetical protein